MVGEYNARVDKRKALSSAQEVGDLAKAGDTTAREAIEVVGAWLGFGLANVLPALNPTVVVVGGGVSQIGDLLLDSARRSLRTYGFPTLAETPILPAALGPQAGMVGAAVLAQRQAAAPS